MKGERPIQVPGGTCEWTVSIRRARVHHSTHDSGQSPPSETREQTHTWHDRCRPECRRVQIMAILALDPPIRDCLSLSVRPRRPRRPRHTTAAWKLLGSYLEVGFAAPPRLLFLGSLASSAATSAGSHAPPPPASISSRHRSARRPPTPQTSARAPHARRGS